MGADDRSGDGDHRHQAATWKRRRRWTGCSAATSATARPKWRCAPRSRRSWTASRWRFSRRRPCSPSSTSRRSRTASPAFPGAHRHGQPVPLQGGAEADPRGPGRREGRHHRRHAPAALEGRAVPRSRAAGRGRGAALRRRAQGEDQAAAQARRRADDDRDADPAHAQHVARRHPRHVDHRDAAEGPAVDPDQRRQVRPGGDLARDSHRARARRSGLFRPQPRRVDLLARQPDHAARARGARRNWPRPDERGRARSG